MNARQIAELAGIYVDTLNKGHGIISRFEQGNRAAEAILAAGYWKPPTIDNDKLVIDAGMLLLEMGECTCTPYGSSHEAFCGYEYLDDLTGPLERAGYVKHRTINTVEELDALPVGTTVFWAEEAWLRVSMSDSGWKDFNGQTWTLIVTDTDPATVLHEPEES